MPRGAQTLPPLQPPATGAALSVHCSAEGTTAGVTGVAEPACEQLKVPVGVVARQLFCPETSVGELQVVVTVARKLRFVPPGQVSFSRLSVALQPPALHWQLLLQPPPVGSLLP